MTRLRKSVLIAVTSLLLFGTAAEAATLRWAGQRDIFSLDPYSYGSTSNLAFLNHIYEGLVRYTPEFKVVPALATEWQLIDNKYWRFKLRQGVKFHNGAAFTADDVIASLKRVSDPSSPLRGNIPLYVGSKKVDNYTVDIEVSAPSPLFLNDLTNIFMFNAQWLIDNKSEKPTDVGAQVEGYTTYHANGTGPFKLESRVPDSKTILVVNDGWWDEKKHNIDRIEFTPITSAATRVAALLSGEVDLVDAAPIQDISRLESTPEIKVDKRSDLRTISIAFNRREKLADGRDNPFNDLRVRQAFDHAIDRNLINKKVMRGLAHPAGVLVAPEIPGYDAELDKPATYDPQLSRKLLAEARQSDLAFTYLCMNDESVNEEDVCSGVVNMLTRAGFKPTLDIGPRAVQTPKRSSGKSDVYMVGWANEPTLDAYSILVQVLSTRRGADGVANYGGWSYPELDNMVKQAAAEQDRDKRLAIETAALKFAKDQAIMIPLHQQPMAWAMTSKIESVVIRADNKPRHWLTRMTD
ncbi:ABC transporter substrate-binding protein [Phyllobacterium myrsinacearum]|uniref:Peptide/nickel transport system substrate-binding protein n=1 Tax=Phyllobacterium myrsinacearum TaxID=28101 RepID=A0A839EN75_9HYPH|nr:ABC transporter substrate-binding protein [Phyllobacterium myrsinacearum]MBA8879655.1 peptide/nickel transport system substrate-binding protein [Phyllobacterium myrsinacearum]